MLHEKFCRPFIAFSLISSVVLYIWLMLRIYRASTDFHINSNKKFLKHHLMDNDAIFVGVVHYENSDYQEDMVLFFIRKEGARVIKTGERSKERKHENLCQERVFLGIFGYFWSI